MSGNYFIYIYDACSAALHFYVCDVASVTWRGVGRWGVWWAAFHGV